ncbi:MAG TPA: S8 family serine peptidase, partial [Bacteroidota bacterium]|nr:S8 family serine peptidase [Bacteroidota bacterium]
IIRTALFAGSPAPLGKLLNKLFPQLSPGQEVIALISFTDKGDRTRMSASDVSRLVSERSLKRRMSVRDKDHLLDENDYPLNLSYVRTVEQSVLRVRHQLKWFNAVSVVATREQIENIRKYPFVKEIELVGRWQKRVGDEEESSSPPQPIRRTPSNVASLDYGTSFTQVNQINVPAVHDLGIYGQGIVIGVLDNGFRLLTHEAFASMNIIAQYDFVDHKPSVIPNNPSTGFGSHGVNTLSTIGGYKPGELIGPAFKSSYILARTENDSSETPIEEDNWAKAIEWADSIGVDVTSTSLGYLSYQAPYTSWTYLDMDGNTTLITKAGDHAAGLGIVVVNSAGNSGFNASHNTLGAPADGDSVISVGAVTSAGARASFSSIGNTTDIPSRIKPDVMAMGVGVKVASSTNTVGYGTSNGTSFSCPLSAGVAALIRCANPTLTAMQVREAMRQTASQSGSPDSLMGWGILNALDAINYYGIPPTGRISGRKFNDINGDGVRDGGEPGIPGVVIRLNGTATDSTLTDGSGDYEFDTLAIGNYTITEDVPPGWMQTLPDSSYSILLLFGVDTSGLDFGNDQPGAIHGMKFNDVNGNGIKDPGDEGLTDWTIQLSGLLTTSTMTDSGGTYAFTDLPAGSYTVSESSKAGWIQTLPANNGSYSVTTYSGLDTMGLDFGNFYAPEKSFPVNEGWNLLSLPLTVSNQEKQSLYPSATSSAFKYQGSYRQIDTILNGFGYWLKFNANQNVLLDGEPRTLDTLEVATGWNMIGSISYPVAVTGIASNPGGLVTSQFFDYLNGYETSDTIFPHHGYWVKVAGNGQLVLASSGTFPSGSRIFIAPTSEMPPDPPGESIATSPTAPARFELYQNFPNPFNPLTVIRYQLPVISHVTLKVYDVLGREVATIVSEELKPGVYTRGWDASGMASGAYYYRLTAGRLVETKILLLVK